MAFVTYPDASIAPKALVIPAARHWRLLFSGSNNPNYITIGDLNFRDEIGTDGIMDGVATASSQFSATYVPARAFDDDPTTWWVTVSGNVDGAWIKMSFSDVRNIKQVRMRAGDTTAAANQMFKDAVVQFSVDDLVWTTASVIPEQTGWAVNENRFVTI